MRKPDILIIDGRAFSWRQLCQLRRQQLAAWEASQPHQPVLFEMVRDTRPPHECTVRERYLAPSLLEFGAMK